MCVCVCVRSCLTLCDAMDCKLPGSSVHRVSQARILELPFPSSGDLPDPGIEFMSLASPALAGGFFTTVPPGKLSKHAQIFKTTDFNINILQGG